MYNKTFQLLLCLCIACFLSEHSYALKPSHTYFAIPDTLKLPYEKNEITTSDNVKLKSWTFLPDKKLNKKTTLVFAYADAGNMSWWLAQATTLSQMGYTVVMFDYRGFGESDSFAIDPKMLYYNEFATDLAAAFHFAKEKYPGNKTGIWAFSMGTIITTLSTSSYQPDFIIGDGYVISPVKLQKHHTSKNKEFFLPANASAYENTLAKIKVPMLLFSGKKDLFTTDAEVQKYKKNKPNVKVINYDGTHLEGFYVLSKDYPGSEYVKKINSFLNFK